MSGLTREGLTTKLDALGEISDEQRREIACSLIGHSRIMTICFGYWSCARCGQQIGDSLGGAFDGRDKIVVGHDCEVCRKNYKSATWQDTFMCPDPFAKPTPANQQGE